jgi:hypothetical protein
MGVTAPNPVMTISRARPIVRISPESLPGKETSGLIDEPHLPVHLPGHFVLRA